MLGRASRDSVRAGVLRGVERGKCVYVYVSGGVGVGRSLRLMLWGFG